MKKSYTKKLIIPSILALILILTFLGLKQNKANKSSISAEKNGFKLEQNSRYGTVKIVSYDKENRYIKVAEEGHKVDAINNMAIPEAVEIEGNNYKITEIGENAFSGLKAFKTVTIPETVEKIGSGAFSECKNLSKVILSGPIAVIASDAFDTVKENPKLVLSYNGEEVNDLTELEKKIIVTLNSSEVINIGKVKWLNSKAEVELSTEYEKYTMQYRVNEGEWTEGTTVSNLNFSDKVEARLAYGESYSIGYASYTVKYANDPTSPTVSLAVTSITSSTITVEASASDGQTGLNGEYKWYLGSTLKSTTTTNTYTFEGLTDYTSYTLKVEVSDNCANTNTASVTAKTDIILSNHNSSELITFGKAQWIGSKIEVKLSTRIEKSTIQYRVNEGEWNEGTTVSNLNIADKIEARLTDGESFSIGYASYTVPIEMLESSELSDVVGFGNLHWSNESGIEVELSTEIEKCTIQYKVNGDKEWNEGTKVSNLWFGDFIDARLTYEGVSTWSCRYNNVTAENLDSSDGIAFNVKWNNSKATVSLSNEITECSGFYRVNEGEWESADFGYGAYKITDLSLNDKVEARLGYSGYYSNIYATYIVAYENDTTEPTLSSFTVTDTTPTTITVKATASDSETGIIGYKWYLGGELKATTTTDTYTFEGLESYKTYTLKVEVSDGCSNTKTASRSAKTDYNFSGNTSESLIYFSNFKYNSAGYYTIYIGTNVSLGSASLLYQINGYTDDGWKTTKSGTTISNLSNGDVVYAKIVGEENSTTGYASYTVVDNAPVINSFYNNYYGTDHINVYWSVQDDMKIQNIEIYCDGSSQYSYSPNSTSYSNSYTIYGLSAGRSYEMKIVVTDNAGQKTERTEYMYTESISDCNGSC